MTTQFPIIEESNEDFETALKAELDVKTEKRS